MVCFLYSNASMGSSFSQSRFTYPVVERKKNDVPAIQKNDRHNQLIAQAREGDEDAIESLTLEDMDTYALLSQRVMKEDIFSIVKSTFMPFGIESDQYTVLGEIIDCVTMENKLTHEKLYGMKLLCNNIQFDVCINEKDLLGEPAIGRRFRGNVWMQGNLCLE